MLRHVKKQHIEKEWMPHEKANVGIDSMRLRKGEGTGCSTTEKDDEEGPTTPDLSRSTVSILSSAPEMTDSIYSDLSQPQNSGSGSDLDVVGWEFPLEY